MVQMAADRSLFYHIGITIGETLISFILVLILGTFISMLLWWCHSAADILEPYLVVLNSLPKTALAPILIVWLGNNMKTIIVCGVTMAIFSTIINLYTAFIHIDSDKLLLIKTLGGTRKDILRYIVLPASISAIVSNLKVNIGLCLVGVIIGEFLAAQRRSGLPDHLRQSGVPAGLRHAQHYHFVYTGHDTLSAAGFCRKTLSCKTLIILPGRWKENYVKMSKC